MPLGNNVSGAYSVQAGNGATVMTAGLAADSEIAQLRWTDASGIALIRAIRISAGAVIAFAAGQLKFELFKATAFTAVGTGGNVTDLTAGAIAGRRRTNYPVSLFGAAGIRVASTAALGAGTKTLDAVPLGGINIAAPTTVGPLLVRVPLLERPSDYKTPITLVQNEGLIVRATVPGTGTWYFDVEAEWEEIANQSLVSDV